MYNVGEFVVYGNSGICEIKEIAELSDKGMPAGKLYYFMVPIDDKNAKIYASVTGTNVGMRRVLTRSEANDIIEEAPDIELIDIANDKQREKRYQEIIRACDCRELVSAVKTLYARRQNRLRAGKKNTTTDEKYFRIAEKNLFSELAFVLDMDFEQVRGIVVKRCADAREKNNE